MSSTNFKIWNPNKINQEDDSAYTADSQRVGGAPNGSPLPSQTFNKFAFQTSAGIYALMQMMASKGYTTNDTNPTTLAATLAAIRTSADQRNALTVVTFSPSIHCDASQSDGFQIVLADDTTISVTGQIPGQRLTFQFIQDSGGGHAVTWPSNFFGGLQPNPSIGHATLIKFEIGSDGTGRIASPAMSMDGIVSTPIGKVNPSTGAFTTLTANTPASTDNSTKAATTAWVRTNVNASNPTVSFTDNGYVKFPGGLIIQWGLHSDESFHNFPILFPHNVFVVVTGNGEGTRSNVYVTSKSASGCAIGTDGSTQSAYYIAIGW